MNIIFRPYKEQDASGVIALLKETYGNGYVKQDLYNPDRINEFNAVGNLMLTVAIDEDEGIVGLIGKEKSDFFKNQCEMIAQIARSDFRNRGISRSLFIYLADTLRRSTEFTSLYAHVLACHSKMQTVAERYGFISCGFVLNLFDTKLFTVNGLDPLSEKFSQTIINLPCNKKSSGVLHVSGEIADLVEETYRGLNVEFELRKDSDLKPSELSEKSDMAANVREDHKYIEICAYKVGLDFVGRVKEIENTHMKDSPLWTCNLFLNMNDKNAIHAYDLLRENGYFFTGVQPLSDSGDFIVMHNPCKLKFKMSDISYIESQKRFANYIKGVMQL